MKFTENNGFAVVELFTSEGCSSCPPADAVIAKLVSKQIKNVYVLSYHVDYWNRLGWKDGFSQQAFSGRQQQYARELSLEGIYTPQVIVNGNTEFVGSNESALNAAIANELKGSPLSNIKITAVRKNDAVIVHYNITGNESMFLNSSIVLPVAATNIKGGENEGRILKHANIVTLLKVSDAKSSGEITMNVPNELSDKSFKVIVYTQAKKSFKIMGADEVDINL